MKPITLLSLTLVFVWLMAPGQALAQRGMGDPTGIGQQSVKPTLTTLSGTLVEIKTEPCEKTTGPSLLGTHLIVRDESGAVYNVHLGPTAIVASTVQQLTVGQPLSLKAFRTAKMPAQHYVAQRIAFGKKEFTLRDATLRPVWAGPDGGRNRPSIPPVIDQAVDDSQEQLAAPPAPMPRGRGVGPQWGGVGPQWGGRGPRWGRGEAPWGGPGPWRGGRGPDASFQADREVFHNLLAAHDQIQRSVTQRPDGIEAVTESNDPAVASAIRDHVAAMHRRLTNGMPIHLRDPLFAALFANANKIKLEITDTEKGVRVVETSDDPYTVKLIQAHADVLTKFVKNGFLEARQDHPVPAK